MTDLPERWTELFNEISVLEEQAQSPTGDPDTLGVVRALASLRLVQVFNWNKWLQDRGGWPTEGDIDTLSMFDCVRFITAVVRSDRFNEGALAGFAGAGMLRGVALRAHDQSLEAEVPSLPEIQAKQ